jgi:hypothetical protein
MPPELAEFFIRFLTDENDLVLDPFAGSNTTGAVAQKAGAALDLVRSRLGLCVLLDRLVCNGRDKKSIEQS